MTQTKLYGLIGFPVKHSLSALMHNAAFEALKINAEYKLFPLKEKEIAPFFKKLRENNIYGLNVTVPYKQRVMPCLDKISPEAKLCGAVNTVKLVKNKLQGFNTDGAGFLRHLTCDLKFNPRGKSAIIIGAGGASRAIAVYLAKSRAKSISIYDIDNRKLKSLVVHLKGHFQNTAIKALGLLGASEVPEADLLVNATPVGMKENDPCPADIKLLRKDMLVYDLIYSPKETKLLKIAKAKGARISNGLGMLLYQGMASFEIWTGKKPPKEVMQKALKGGL